MDVRGWITRRIIGFLTEPLPYYERIGWNDLGALRRQLQKADVLLVEGDTRVSVIIKYLTQSSWSHSALYVGDEILRRGGERARRARERFGDEAGELIVEALPEGVVASPVSKYIDFNVRLMRPHRLRSEHRQAILNDAIATLGWTYDLRNVFDLARYLIPVSFVPNRFRRTALHFGSGAPTEVICSSLIGQLFQKVRFPIMPHVELPGGFDSPEPRRPGVLRRLFGYESSRFTGLFHMRHPTLLTPKDFDLSPYFEVVKFNLIADETFDYQRIRWADAEAEAAGEGPAPEIAREAERDDRG